MKLRVISDGTLVGTRVEDEAGNVLEGVTAVYILATADEDPIALIKVRGIGIDFVVNEQGVTEVTEFHRKEAANNETNETE